MFHKAADISFGEGTILFVTFRDGQVKRYDISELFDKYPAMEALKDRELFTSGRLMGAYGIMWNDELDLEAETVYEEGETVEIRPLAGAAADAVLAARAKMGISQSQLSQLSGIDQADISRIERGIANPSINTLEKLAAALGGVLRVSIE